MTRTFDTLLNPSGPQLHQNVNYYNWHPSGLSGVWVHDNGHNIDFQGRNNVSRQIRKDDPPWKYQYMQDCIRDQWALSMAPGIGHADEAWHGTTGLDTNLGHMAIMAGPGRACVVTSATVLNEMIDRGAMPFDYRRLVGSAGSDLAYRALETSPITKQAIINQKDPLDSEFSIWYLLRDLKELPKLIRTFRNMVNLKAFVKSRHSTFKQVSQSHLAIQFGLLPTLADMKSFVDLIVKWGTAVESKQKLFEKVYTGRNPIREIDRQTLSGLYFWLDKGSSAQCRIDIAAARVRALCQTTKFYFVYPELAGFLNRMRLFVDLLGVFDLVNVGWDLVPFSFLVDWVVDVGGWLHKNMKPRTFPATLVICDWSESIHEAANISGIVSYTGARSDGLAAAHNAVIYGDYRGIARRRQFPRHLGVSTKDIFQPDSIVTIRRVFLGAALIGSKGKIKQVKRPTDYHHRGKKKKN